MDDTEPIGRLIEPGVAEMYLLAHGWEAKRRTRDFSTWAKGDGDDGHGLFLPLSKEPADFEERLRAFVNRLAAIESIDTSAALTNLRYAASDLVRVRLMSPRVGPGELPITDGARLFDGARDMIQAAACSAVEHRPAWGTRKPGTVTQYLDGVRLGQTERGSYVVTVISDVEPEDQGAILPDEATHLHVPFERRVTTELVTSLNAANGAAERVLAGESVTVFEDAIDDGVSANLCDAIRTMGEESVSSTVEVTVDWAVSRRPTVEQRLVAFGPQVLPVMEDASRTLKQLGPFEDVEVVGVVGLLDRGAADEVGVIVIEGVAAETKRNVRVELSDAQYHAAVRAHDERRTVSIRGTLLKDGKSWRLLDPGPLRLEA